MSTPEVEPEAAKPQSRRTRLASWLWCAVPLISLGALTWIAFAYAGIRRRSARLWMAAVVYLAAMVTSIALNANVNGDSGSATWPMLPMLLIAGVLGTAHAVLIRSLVFGQPPVRYGATPSRVTSGLGPDRLASVTAPPTVPLPPPAPSTPAVPSPAPSPYQRWPLTPEQRESQRRRARREHWNAVIVLSLMACFGLAIAGGCGYLLYRSAGESNGGTRDEAIAACEHFVSEDLKAPSSADFPLYRDDRVTNIGKVYTVSGYVDAENSFGAKLRLNYTCTVKWHPNKKAWGLLDISGLN